MNRTIAAVLALLVIAGLPVDGDSSAAAQTQASYRPGEVLVKLRATADLADVAGAYSLDAAPLDQFGSNAIYRLAILDGSDPRDRAAELALDPRVIYADPNYIGGAPEPVRKVSWAVGGDGLSYAEQWAAGALHLDAAHARATGTGITVAVLDTGVDLAHPALTGHLAPGYDFVDGDSDPQEAGTAGIDPGFGHGTHVAGIVSLAAPDALIMPVRVLDESGAGNTWVLAEALHFAVDPDGNPATADGADVVNLSLTMPRKSRLIRDVLGAVSCGEVHASPTDLPCFQSGGRGAVVVAAAGNSASSAPEYPAGFDIAGELAVGATRIDDAIAAFSNTGSWVDVAAPGDRIISTVPGGAYGTWSGTSMASPFAAGVAALVRQLYPELSTPGVSRQLRATAALTRTRIPLHLDALAAVATPPQPD